MSAFHKFTAAVPFSLVFCFSVPGALAQVEVKSTSITNIDGNRFFVANFRRKGADILSYQLSTNLTNWGTPGSGGFPGISTSVSSDDLLVTSVRINQAITGSSSKYFLRALYEFRYRPRLDFDGDGKTDFVLVRNTGGGSSGAITWFITLSGGGTRSVVHGIASDFCTPGDFDGDGLCDIAIRRSPTPEFRILQSSDGALRVLTLGLATDNPTVCADYDGDGITDPAIFRSSATGNSFIYLGSNNNPSLSSTTVTLGTTSGFANPGDYDGDRKVDSCVQVTGTLGVANFLIRRSTDNITETVPFGTPTDVVQSGDVDGDRKDDIVLSRGVSGSINWHVRERDGGGTGNTPIIFGASATDFQACGDYDGDGKLDIATWTPSVTPGASAFKVRRSSDGGTTVFNFGLNGDFPVAKNYVH